MKEDHYSVEICRDDEEADLSDPARRFIPLPFENADGILQNVLRICGYKEAHMKKNYAAL